VIVLVAFMIIGGAVMVFVDPMTGIICTGVVAVVVMFVLLEAADD